MIKSARGRVLLGLAIAIASLAAVVWALQRRPRFDESQLSVGDRRGPINSGANQFSPITEASISPTVETASPSPNAPQSAPTLPPQSGPTPAPAPSPIGFIGRLNLIIPVMGVRPDQLQDTFTAARSEGRVHDAIDIPAPAGTPVVAAVDGEIIKLFQSERGGTTVYQLSTDKKLIFYYAHLQRYAEGLLAGKFVRQGDIIGYVGDTGNAGPGNYHLHFSISIIADPKRYWEGSNINPYPLLHR